MTRISLVAAVAANGVIGRHGQIPWHLPGEQARFKTLTMGHTLIMGRLTFDAIGRVLPGRRSIVITRNRQWQHPDVETAHSLPDALALAGPGDEVFVIGGAQIYAAAMPLAQRMVLSHVHADPVGDAYFPQWDPREWAELSRDPGEAYDVVTYARR